MESIASWSEKPTYCQLNDSESESERHFETSRSPVYRRVITVARVIPWILHVVFLVASISFFIAGERTTGLDLGPLSTREYAKAVRESGEEKSIVQFLGEFGAPSPWRGRPTPEIDLAWEKLDPVIATSVTKEEVEDLGKLRNSSVQFPDGGYLASIAAFHQVHCLNVLRKYSYLDYYVVTEPDFFTSSTLRTHVDHCIEMLRQVLMCNADLHVIVYDWVAEVDYPWADFGTNYQCRDYQKVYDWGKENSVKTDAPGGLMQRPDGVALKPIPKGGDIAKVYGEEYHHHPHG